MPYSPQPFASAKKLIIFLPVRDATYDDGGIPIDEGPELPPSPDFCARNMFLLASNRCCKLEARCSIIY